MGNRFDPNNPDTRYYKQDPFLDPSAVEAPEGAIFEVPGIQTGRKSFYTLQVIEPDMLNRFVLDGDIVYDISNFDIANKLIETGQNACFIFASPVNTWIYWKWVSTAYASVAAGPWEPRKGEIKSKADQILRQGYYS